MSEKDYEELKQLAEKTGVTDVTKAYNEYSKLTQPIYDALNESEDDVTYFTSSSTC